MNMDNINRIIDWLNRGAPEVVFSMNYSNVPIDYMDQEWLEERVAIQEAEKFGHCGSVCCIAGAAEQAAGCKPSRQPSWSLTQMRALEFFGLPETNREMLPIFDPDLAPERCTPQIAAKALKLWATRVPFDINYNPWPEVSEDA